MAAGIANTGAVAANWLASSARLGERPIMLRTRCCLGTALVLALSIPSVGRSVSEETFEIIEVGPSSFEVVLERDVDDYDWSPVWSQDLRNWNESGESDGPLTVTIVEPSVGIAGGIETVRLAAAIQGPAPARLFLRREGVDTVAPAPAGFALIRAG